MRRIEGSSQPATMVSRLLERAPRGLRDLLGAREPAVDGEVNALAISARKIGSVLQLSIANPSSTFVSSIEVVMKIEYFDRDTTSQDRREVDFLSPREEVLLAIPAESEAISRLWCSTTFTLLGEQHTATGSVALA